jgi:hypothetical protein
VWLRSEVVSSGEEVVVQRGVRGEGINKEKFHLLEISWYRVSGYWEILTRGRFFSNEMFMFMYQILVTKQL